MDNESDALNRAAKKRSISFPALCSKDNRPVSWNYGLDTLEDVRITTNVVTILSRPVLDVDESGENGFEKFAVVTLTRAEISEILRVLDEDIAEMRKYCPDHVFA
jgi:hypothetical protein